MKLMKTAAIIRRSAQIGFLGVVLAALLACHSLKKQLPDHTQDYREQAVSVPPLSFPPGVSPIQVDDHYYVQPLVNQGDGPSGGVSLVPPHAPELSP